MRAIFENVSRRGFIGGAAMGTLVVGMRVLPRSDAAAPPAVATDVPRFDPMALIAIDTSGLVTITAHRSEMGQGLGTGLAMVIADELEADWSRVRVSQALADETIYFGQNTDDLWNVRHFLQAMLQMGAAVRQMLQTAAAASWGVDMAHVHARNHRIIHIPTGRVFGYAQVAAVARALSAPRAETLQLKKRAKFCYFRDEGLQLKG